MEESYGQREQEISPFKECITRKNRERGCRGRGRGGGVGAGGRWMRESQARC